MDPLRIITSYLPSGRVGEYYSAHLWARGGSYNYRWYVSGFRFPYGLSLSRDGEIYGYPREEFSGYVEITVTDNWSRRDSSIFYMDIRAPYPPPLPIPPPDPLRIESTSLPTGTVGEYFNAQLWASGGRSPYHWYLSGSRLPYGLNLSTDGLISGTPNEEFNGYVEVTVVDRDNRRALNTFGIRVYAAPLPPEPPIPQPPIPVPPVPPTPPPPPVPPASLRVDTMSLPGAKVGELYTTQLSVSGGNRPYRWTLPAESRLPEGLTLAEQGTLVGVPTAAFNGYVEIEVLDSRGRRMTLSAPLFIGMPTATLPAMAEPLVVASVDIPVNQGFSGPEQPVSLAKWLEMDDYYRGRRVVGIAVTGSATGTATEQATLTLQAGETALGEPLPLTSTSSTQYFSVDRVLGNDIDTWQLVASGAIQMEWLHLELATCLRVATRSLPFGKVNEAYQAQLSAFGGSLNYAWTLAAESRLPEGLTLTEDGVISGTTAAAFDSYVDIALNDGSGRQLTLSVPLLISDGTAELPAAPEPIAVTAVDVLVKQTLDTATGAVAMALRPWLEMDQFYRGRHVTVMAVTGTTRLAGSLGLQIDGVVQGDRLTLTATSSTQIVAVDRVLGDDIPTWQLITDGDAYVEWVHLGLDR